MIPAHIKIVDRVIKDHGDGWWNGVADKDLPKEDQQINREFVLEELLSILAKGNLTLEIIRTNR